MEKHKFLIGVNENGITVGAQCVRCAQIALYENGKVPDDIKAQECKGRDENQTAAQIVREATEQ